MTAPDLSDLRDEFLSDCATDAAARGFLRDRLDERGEWSEPHLRALVIARPQPDWPRLLYADHCEQAGDAARAEFVRVQCELARCSSCASDQASMTDFACDCDECLRPRERELWGTDALIAMGYHPPVADVPAPIREWAAISPQATLTVQPGGFIRPGAYWVRRGFVEAITCEAPAWLAHADALTAACPLRRVRLIDWPALDVTPESPSIRAQVRFRDRPEMIWAPEPADLLSTEPLLRRDVIEGLLAAEWPGIEFELPAAVNDARPVGTV